MSAKKNYFISVEAELNTFWKAQRGTTENIVILGIGKTTLKD